MYRELFPVVPRDQAADRLGYAQYSRCWMKYESLRCYCQDCMWSSMTWRESKILCAPSTSTFSSNGKQPRSCDWSINWRYSLALLERRCSSWLWFSKCPQYTVYNLECLHNERVALGKHQTKQKVIITSKSTRRCWAGLSLSDQLVQWCPEAAGRVFPASVNTKDQILYHMQRRLWKEEASKFFPENITHQSSTKVLFRRNWSISSKFTTYVCTMKIINLTFSFRSSTQSRH